MQYTMQNIFSILANTGKRDPEPAQVVLFKIFLNPGYMFARPSGHSPIMAAVRDILGVQLRVQFPNRFACIRSKTNQKYLCALNGLTAHLSNTNVFADLPLTVRRKCIAHGLLSKLRIGAAQMGIWQTSGQSMSFKFKCT